MTGRSSRHQAAIWLGVASLLSLVFLAVKRELHFVQIPDAGIAVAIVFGLLAIVGGWLGSRALTLAAGTGFLLAAAAQVILQTSGSPLANGSNGSTFGLWLGLGFGLLTLALTPAVRNSGMHDGSAPPSRVHGLARRVDPLPHALGEGCPPPKRASS